MKTTKSKKEKWALWISRGCIILAILFLLFSGHKAFNSVKNYIYLSVGILVLFGVIFGSITDNLKTKRIKAESEAKFLFLLQNYLKGIKLPVNKVAIIFHEGAKAALESKCSLEFIEKRIEQLK